MTSVHEMPGVMLVIPLGLGICIANFFEFPLSYSFVPFAILFLFLFFIYIYSRNYKAIQSSNILLALLLISGGASSMKFSNQVNQQEDIPKYADYSFEGIVADVKQSGDKYTCIFKVSRYFDKELSHTRNFYIRLIVTNSDDEILSGDDLIIYGKLTPIFENKSPNTFNFKKYLAHKHIFYQLKVGSEAVLSHRISEKITLLPTRFKNYAQTIFKNNLSPEAASIAIGMITGSKSNIPEDLLETYSKVGVMHLLAVSGLHVGIISEALFFLFGQKKKRSKKTATTIFIIIAIWLFVLFTGSSASTVRAGLMFTMLYLGRITDRLYNPFNAIACTAFGLLIYDPHYLFDLGFQLSYLAVTSIIFFFPLIKSFWDTTRSNWLIDKMWNLAVLSISANILILPLTVYYFNQVPIYFPITNIVAVPAAFGIVTGGIVMIFLEIAAPFISEYYSILYELIIDSTNWFLKFMEKLPFSTTENITIDNIQLTSIYVSLLILIAMIVKNKIAFLKYIVASGALLFFYSNYKSNLQSQVSKFTIYNCYNKTAIDFTYGDKTYSHVDSTLSQSFFDFNIKPNRLANNSSELIEIADLDLLETGDLYKRKSFMVFADKLFFLPASKTELENIPPETDFVILDHTHYVKKLTVSPNTIVILRNDEYLNNWKIDIPEDQLIRIYKHGAYTKILDDV